MEAEARIMTVTMFRAGCKKQMMGERAPRPCALLHHQEKLPSGPKKKLMVHLVSSTMTSHS